MSKSLAIAHRCSRRLTHPLPGHTALRNLLLAAVVACGVAFVLSSPRRASADNRTWDGGGATNN